MVVQIRGKRGKGEETKESSKNQSAHTFPSPSCPQANLTLLEAVYPKLIAQYSP